MSARRLLFLGPPGVGKGTQAARLAEKLAIPQISTGDMLRAAVAEGSAVGREARGYMDRGELVPDHVVIGVAEARLGQPDAAHGFILDGFPRTVPQAEALDGILDRLGRSLDVCLLLVAEEDELVQRISRRAELEGRSDDSEETARNRMRVYQEQTEPLVAYYRKRGILREVDGIGSIEDVAGRIEEATGTC